MIGAETALSGAVSLFFNPPTRSGLPPSHPKAWPLTRQKGYHHPVWICPECNQPVPSPVNRKCPNGHALFDGRIMAFTSEQSVLRAFFSAILVCLGILAAVTGINALIPGQPLGKNAAGYPLIAFIVAGILALLRALKWKRQGGPVARLVPRAVGIGFACLLAGAAPFVAGIALGLIH
jgi:hypothetical protein